MEKYFKNWQHEWYKNQSFENSSLVENELKSNFEYFRPQSSASYYLRQEQYVLVSDQIKDVVKKEIQKMTRIK